MVRGNFRLSPVVADNDKKRKKATKRRIKESAEDSKEKTKAGTELA